MILNPGVVAQNAVDEGAAGEPSQADLEVGDIIDDASAVGEREVAQVPQIPPGQGEVDRHTELLEGG